MHPLGLVFQCQVSLRHDADYAAFSIHHGNTPDLVLLHQAFALVYVFAVAASHRGVRDGLLNLCCLRVQTVRDNRAAEIPIRDHAGQCPRLLICDDWYGTHVEIAHHLGRILCAVIWRTARWVCAHHFFDLHAFLQTLMSVA